MDRTLNTVVEFDASTEVTAAPTQLNDLELALVGGGIGDTTL